MKLNEGRWTKLNQGIDSPMNRNGNTLITFEERCHTPIFFFLMIIIYSSTKELKLKYSISALKNLNVVEFLLEFVQKEDMENLL